MNDPVRAENRPDDDPNSIAPLPGEPGIPNVAERQRLAVSKKGLLALGLFVLTLIVIAAFTIQKFAASGKKPDEESKRVSDRPTAATAEPRRLEMPVIATASASTPAVGGPRIPAIVPTADELAEPIGVRRTGAGAPSGGNTKVVAPEDAPVLLVTSRPTPPNAAPALPARHTEPVAATGGEPRDIDPKKTKSGGAG